MKIYQVQNESGNPASREGNEEAIFLSLEKAQEHINFLHDECGLTDMSFEIVELNKTYYFTVTDEEGRTAGIIKASTSEQLKKAFSTLALEHYVLDDTQVSQKLLINNFIGEDKTVTVKGIIDGDEEIFYDMQIESVLLYE